MRKALSIILFSSILTTATAGNGVEDGTEENRSQKIQVVDHSNLESLAGASIYIRELDKTIYADFDGFVNLNGIPKGEYSISVQLISYDRIEIEHFEIGNKAGITKLRLKSTTL